MDQTLFDELTRTLVAPGSRRSLLRPLLAAAGLLAGGRSEIAAARHHHRHRHSCASDTCPACQTCQKGKCVPTADGAACGGDCGVCESGLCQPHDADCDPCDRCDPYALTCRPRCGSNQSCCNGVCCDTGCTIPDGTCCPPDRFCAGHLCCGSDETCCNGHCEPLSRNPHPCGATGCCFGTEVCCQPAYGTPGCVPAESCTNPV